MFAMAINKVNYGNQTLIDLTDDTATEGDVVSGKTFHLRSGATGTGSLDSKVAASGGTDLSLVTTGEKYIWNNKTQAVELTQVEYDALSSGEKNDPTKVYFITDQDPIFPSALTNILGNFADIEVSPAQSAHAVGSYLIYEEKLYKVTAAIAVNDALTVGTNITQTDVGSEAADVGNEVESLWSKIYPIGSIYMSVLSTNPSTLFGGTWTQLENRFLLGAGSAYTNGATGGSKDAIVVKHTHTQKSCTNPGNHNHIPSGQTNNIASYYGGNKNGLWGDGNNLGSFGLNAAGGHTHTITLNDTGSSGTNANMPPYLVVYMWKRVA